MSRSRLLQDIIDSIPADFADPEGDFQATREMFAQFHGHPTSDAYQVEIRHFGGVPCGYSSLADNTSALTIFHCHGGAFVSCPLSDYHFYGEMMASQLGGKVVMPDYRLAPEHPYPAAQDDCFNAYQGLLQSGIDPQQLVVMGESCGGGLAVGTLVRAVQAGLPMPACYVSLTGWYDLSLAGPRPAVAEPFLTPQFVCNRAADYLAGQMQPADARVSPAYANLQGLPPMYLQVGEFDTVREGALRLAGNALRSGVAVSLEAWPGMIQGWHGLLSAGVPEAQAAWRAIAAYIGRHTG